MCSYKHVLSVYLKELKAKKAPDAQPSKFDGIGEWADITIIIGVPLLSYLLF